ncbi:hypothetical protein BpHYR1_032931 [Brachionus plicatilis]|uniref:Uncharacterized protein n=1 Tax=Brachionus plicatilis TaxID=10195 RepID=A0A3M7SW52_BRAPC|nr:hypothetical protein BpHYR1_032931 [Brachionus plicatilis]
MASVDIKERAECVWTQIGLLGGIWYNHQPCLSLCQFVYTTTIGNCISSRCCVQPIKISSKFPKFHQVIQSLQQQQQQQKLQSGREKTILQKSIGSIYTLFFQWLHKSTIFCIGHLKIVQLVRSRAVLAYSLSLNDHRI